MPRRPISPAEQASSRPTVSGSGKANAAAQATRRRPRSEAPAGPPTTTRERVLDVALDLFVEQGYDKTSLREVAERMGFTKAALYYHFPSKADMLVALHQRMHALMDKPLAVLGEGSVRIEDFERFLDVCLGQMQANQKLFLLHRVNQAAVEKLHIEGHDSKHVDLEDRARRLFSDRSISKADRVRMAAAFSTAMVTPLLMANWFPEDASELTGPLRQVVREVLGMSSDPGHEGAGGSGNGPAPRRRPRGAARPDGARP